MNDTDTARFSIPGSRRIREAFSQASFGERFIAGILSVVFAGSALSLVFQVHTAYSVTVPTYGGTLTEGVVGAPRFINPLLATTDADRDLIEVVYAGLMTATPEGGFTEEIAERYTLSEDGLVYTFTIRQDAFFHDGEPLTADDVVFTVTKAQDSALKSPKRPNWEGVRVDKVDDYTVQFTLAEPYALFLENTTLGILPKHIWDTATAEQFAFSKYNLEPIGAGPYRVSDIKRNNAGIPEEYRLTSWDDYTLGRPYISRLTFHFYPNEEALRTAHAKGVIDSMSAIAPAYAAELESKGVHLETHPLPRIFGVFFNQNEATLFTNREVRRALQESIDTQALISTVLSGYGTPANGPLPPQESDSHNDTYSQGLAQTLLEDNGWEKDAAGIYTQDGARLAFTISTANTPELKETAEFLQREWNAFGADVSIEVFDIGALNQDIIRPRNFEALLFGQILGRTPDPFAFWHSSQRNDPGLNVALYANITTDDIVESIRTEFNSEKRTDLYTELVQEIQNDQPATFLYAPDFIYVIPNAVAGVTLGTVTTPAERFLNIHDWYLRTDTVWTVFQ